MATQETIHSVIVPSRLGLVLSAFSAQGLCAILIDDDAAVLAAELERRFPKAHIEAADAGTRHKGKQVAAYVENSRGDLDLPLDIRGTAFQKRVWEALRRVPAGKTASYTDIAQDMGAGRAVRAVAGACAANHLAVIIPCHRIVRRDGGLSGYYWGIERKRALLQHEGIHLD